LWFFDLNLMARPLHYERFYREVEQTMRELVPGKQINLSINEWGPGFALPDANRNSEISQ
jgi:hypothetical protein